MGPAASQKSPLHDLHVRLGARLVEFAGWSMPIQYSSIVGEHLATRQSAGMFDVSHMGRLYFFGRDAGQFLDRLVTRRVIGLPTGQIRYGLICRNDGGILDDILVYQLSDPAGSPFYVMVVNAGNRAKIVAWLRDHQRPGEDLYWEDRTEQTAMIAVQGPQVIRRLAPLCQLELAPLAYYRGRLDQVAGRDAIVSRTGYTGEDGCELIVHAADAVAVWQAVAEATQAQPAGLGARDTLRLEAGMPLYGHELSEDLNPFQAGLAFAVNLKDRDFVGHAALRELSTNQQLPRRVGLTMPGKRAAREGYAVCAGEQRIGTVTSGSLSPTLGYPIAMAYLPPACTAAGSEVAIDLRGTRAPARVVTLPFYRRAERPV